MLQLQEDWGSLLQGEFKIILGTQSKIRHRQEVLRGPFQNHPISTRWVLRSPESTFPLAGHKSHIPAKFLEWWPYWARHFNIPDLRFLICKMEMKILLRTWITDVKYTENFTVIR